MHDLMDKYALKALEPWLDASALCHRNSSGKYGPFLLVESTGLDSQNPSACVLIEIRDHAQGILPVASDPDVVQEVLLTVVISLVSI
jgi:hypothetical protein